MSRNRICSQAWIAALAWCGVTSAAIASAWTTTLVSEGFTGDVGNNVSTRAMVGGDGRYVAFASAASNLAAGVVDSNAASDAFLFDRVAQATTVISRAASDATRTANGGSDPVAISDDGNTVLFESDATDLIAGVVDNNLGKDLFLYDRSSGSRILISRAAASATTAANGGSEAIALSPDGRWVLFESSATNLVAGGSDGNGVPDVFLFDRNSGTTTLVSRASGSPTTTANGESFAAALSSNGQWIVFSSLATNLVAGLSDGNGGRDAYLFDRASGTTTLVSRTPGAPAVTANQASYARDVSDDGAWILYSSFATNLVSGVTDDNLDLDVFLFDRVGGTSVLVSRAAGAPTSVANAGASGYALSADGQRVLFGSGATNVVTGVADGNGTTDVFLFDRTNGASTLVSRTQASPLTAANSGATPVALSTDGSRVLFASTADNILAGGSDGNSAEDVFLFDAGSGAMMLVSRAASGPATTANAATSGAAMDAQGNWVAYLSLATNVVAGVADQNVAKDVLLFDRGSGANTLASRAFGSGKSASNNASELVGVSADGNDVLYRSLGSNALPGVSDLNANLDGFLFDRSIGGRSLISRSLGSATTTANEATYPVAQSGDGRWVLYNSLATDLVAGLTDGNGAADVFLYDSTTGISSLVSRSHTSATTTANAASTAIALSADGTWVLYRSTASNLVPGFADGNGSSADLFLFDRGFGSSILVSRALGSSTASSNGAPLGIALSPDGRWVLFQSTATNVLAGLSDTNAQSDVFLFDRQAGSTLLVSRALGSATTTANNAANGTAMSADGGRVLYRTRATNVVAGLTDSGSFDDVFVFDRASGNTTLISRSAEPWLAPAAGGPSFGTAMSPNGRWVLFTSRGTNIAPAAFDTNNGDDVLLFDMDTSTLTLVSRALGSPTATANGASTAVGLSDDGGRVVFFSDATNVVPGVTDSNGSNTDIFVFDRDSGGSTLISHAANSPSVTAAGSLVLRAAISNDGSTIAWHTTAGGITGDVDANSESDVFLSRFSAEVFANGFE